MRHCLRDFQQINYYYLWGRPESHWCQLQKKSALRRRFALIPYTSSLKLGEGELDNLLPSTNFDRGAGGEGLA